MKTRYKILLVIAMTLFVYGGLYLAISSGLMLDFNDNSSKTTDAQIQTEELIVEKIEDTPSASVTQRVGVQFLSIDPRSTIPEKYHEVKAANYSWIQRLLTDGETMVNEKELNEYFKIIDADSNVKFGITMDDGSVEYYSIFFYEVQNMDPSRHYIKVYPLYDQPTKNLRTVSTESNSWLTKLSDDRFSWVLVDENTYNDYKNLVLEGNHLRMMNSDGIFENVRLQYAGANSAVQPTDYSEHEEDEH